MLEDENSEIYIKKSGSFYYQVFNEPKFFIKRKIFNVAERDFLQYEKKKVQVLRNNFLDDKVLQKKITYLKMESVFSYYVLDTLQDSLRFLNMFSYDVDRAINSMHKFVEIVKKLKLTPNILINEHTQSEEGLSFIYTLGKDNSNHPVIAVDIMQVLLEKSKFTCLDFIKIVVSKMNKIINSEMTKGEAESFVLFIDMGDLIPSDLHSNHSEIIKLFQYLFPSRLKTAYISVTEKSKDTLILIQKNFLQFNLERLIIFDASDKSLIKKMSRELNPRYTNMFFINKIRNSVNNASDRSFINCVINDISRTREANYFHQTTFSNEPEIKEANLSTSKQNYSSNNNSTWINSNFKIDCCNNLTINKNPCLSQKLTLCSSNGFSINNINIEKVLEMKEKDRRSEIIKCRTGNFYNNWTLGNSRAKIILEKQQNNNKCCPGEDICFIF